MSLKPSVCIDAVFEGTDEIEAINAVASLGYPAIEFWKWWEKDLDAILSARDQHSLEIAACCTKFVSLVDPAARDEYLSGLQESIHAASRLACPTLISQVGDFRVGVSRDEQFQSLVDGLRESAKLLNGTGIKLAVEPLNELVDHQGYYLIRSDEAFEIIEQVNSPDVLLTFDIYHQQISEGHLIKNILPNIDKIAHFHAAGNPGRHELNVGEIHYPAIFDAICSTTFDGFVGLEYWPQRPPIDGLREVRSWFD